MRTIYFTLNGHHASVTLPAQYFDDYGNPKYHLLNSKFCNPFIVWERPIGGVNLDGTEQEKR
jgi:hypothetical protein